MNATQLQTRLKNLAYRIVVLCESLPYGKTLSITHDKVIRAGKTGLVNDRSYRTTWKGEADKLFREDLATALKDVGGALFQLRSTIDLHLVHPAKLSSLQREADELTSIFNRQEIAVKKNESPGHNQTLNI